MEKPVQFLRIMGLLDGISLLILIGFAMPLKYFADLPLFVTIFGGLHGFIFVLYVLAIIYVTFRVRWNILWSIIAIAVDYIPFGNFIFDIQLKKLIVKYESRVV